MDGLGLLIAPEIVATMGGFPDQDPLLIGSIGSDVASGLVAILGFLSALKFAPVLLLQLCYKLIWFIAVFLPAVIAGSMPSYRWMFAGIFATFVIGDLIAIPFPIVLHRGTNFSP